ncbi:hypothetical protein M9Y10_026250 [Tritrichomonas musculus]|uniref:Condensation domain-containing protein n=2 Tax=Tritrichomonas musculus TaxID=1915356 RepID=A0ABR2H731_9EUKA
MLSLRKAIDSSEYYNIISGNSVVLAMKFNDKETVKHVIEKMKNEILGLNLRVDGNFFVKRNKEDIKVHDIPSSTHFESIQKLTEWTTYKNIPNMKHELGTISANDDTIVLNLNHSVSDGKYIAGVVNHISDEIRKQIDNYFPITFDEEFSEEIKERLKSPPKFFENDPNITIFSKFGMKRVDREILHDSVYDTKSFSNYDPKKKVCSNMTAAILTGYSLSLSILEGKDDVFNIGGSLAVDMRKVLKEKKSQKISNLLTTSPIASHSKYSLSLNHANFFSIIPIAIHVTPQTRIDQCYKELNAVMKNQLVDHKEDLFDFRCSMNFTNPTPRKNGVIVGFSNLGPIQIKDPIKDLYLLNIDFNIVFPYIILFTYSIIDEKNNRNDFHAQVRYECNGLTKEQSDNLSKLFKFYLQTVKTSNTIGEIFKEMKSFQKGNK